MTTRGDQILDRTLSKVGGKGLFVKELEQALLDGRADLAVHSMKDVPAELAPEFILAATLKREDPRDAFVSNTYAGMADMPPGSIVGTSSLRRESQVRKRYPHLVIHPLRGNLDTRLRKLDAGEYGAIVLAAAGLKRLGLSERIRALMTPTESLPSPGQGALAIETRAGRPELEAWLAPLNDADTAACVRAERVISQALGGSCSVPLAAYGVIEDGRLRLRACVATVDGMTMLESELTGEPGAAAALGERAAAALMEQGAARIIAALKDAA
jgi:hydroxymethylbilane synthase